MYLGGTIGRLPERTDHDVGRTKLELANQVADDAGNKNWDTGIIQTGAFVVQIIGIPRFHPRLITVVLY